MASLTYFVANQAAAVTQITANDTLSSYTAVAPLPSAMIPLTFQKGTLQPLPMPAFVESARPSPFTVTASSTGDYLMSSVSPSTLDSTVSVPPIALSICCPLNNSFEQMA